MKFFRSRAHLLGQELKFVKEELRAKDEQIEGLGEKMLGITPRFKANPSRSSKHADSSPTPSYLRPTKASEARYKQQSTEDTALISGPLPTPPPSEIFRPSTTFEDNTVVIPSSEYQSWGEINIDYQGLRWDDSELLVSADEALHHYQSSTTSSIAKKRYPVLGSYYRRNKDAGKDSWGDEILISSEPDSKSEESNRHLESCDDRSDSESVSEPAEDLEKRDLSTKLEDCVT